MLLFVFSSDVEEELNRVEKDETEIVSKPQNIQNSKMNKVLYITTAYNKLLI